MTAPVVSNVFPELTEKVGYQLNVNFSDLVNYIALRNNGTAKWDNLLVAGLAPGTGSRTVVADSAGKITAP